MVTFNKGMDILQDTKQFIESVSVVEEKTTITSCCNNETTFDICDVLTVHLPSSQESMYSEEFFNIHCSMLKVLVLPPLEIDNVGKITGLGKIK